MINLTMCINHTCLKRSECYRYRVTPDKQKYRQAYSEFKTCPDNNHKFFMPVINRFTQHLRGAE